MYREVLLSINEAEDAARLEKQNAQASAKNMIAEAEKMGQSNVSKAVLRADEEVKMLLNEANQKATENAAVMLAATSLQQAEIRRHAGSRLDEAADIIVERIVNG